jgi:hypothetical protein
VATYYAGGGGGGAGGGSGTGSGGNGGGGSGGTNAGTAGTNGLGGGGGGSGYDPQLGGNGGNGVVIISYPTGTFNYTYSGTSTTGTNGSETWVAMTTSGNLVLTANSVVNGNFFSMFN